MFWMVETPSADMAAISSATPARMSGEVMRVARRHSRWSWPMTVARCGSQRMICAPMSISLSTKNRRLSNIFWWISTAPLACVATTRKIDSRSGVSPGHGASAMVIIEPSRNVSML